MADPTESGAEEEFVDLKERVRSQTERIRALEQALDQSLASLDDLRSQVVNQQFLEQQLASTEAFANVQQQAIHQLKLQFAQEKAELEAQLQQWTTREQTGYSEPPQLGSLPEAQDLAATGEDQEVALQLAPAPAETRADELAQQIQHFEAHQTQLTQAFVQQAFQELEHDRQQSQHRIAELERQAAEMQEQILSQAQQASEYETAVQHWKSRFYALQAQLQRVKQWLEDSQIELPAEVHEGFTGLEVTSIVEPKSLPRGDSLHQNQNVDVPEFLARRRIYRRNSEQN